MTLPLALLLASVASPIASGIMGGMSGKQSTPFKGWMSPSLGLQDPYLVNAVLGRGLQYGLGDQKMFGDIQGVLGQAWPQILRDYKKQPTVGGHGLRG